MALSIDIKIDKGLARMGRLPDDILQELKTTARAQANTLRGIARDKANGRVLQVRTGKLLKSIKVSVRTSKTGVRAKLYSYSPLANIFEYGDAHIPPHLIEVKNKKALHFIDWKSSITENAFAASVRNPGATLKQRSVILSTFGQEKREVEQALRDAVADGIRKNQATVNA